MRLVLNILWLVLAGLWLFLGYVGAGIVNCIFIITIPFGIQSFKLAGFALWPFGRMVVDKPGGGSVLSGCANIIWLLTAGIWLALTHAITGILLCLTVIGIPFGIQNFKLMGLALAPFGKTIARSDSPTAFVQGYVMAPPGPPPR